MIKNPIKKNGELNYLVVLIYSIIIGFFLVGLLSLLKGFEYKQAFKYMTVINIFVILYVVELIVAAIVEFFTLLHDITTPLIHYIRKLRVSIEFISSTTKQENNVTVPSIRMEQLCVFRC